MRVLVQGRHRLYRAQMCSPQPSTAASMAGPGWRFLLLVHPNKLILMLRGRTKFTFSVAFVRLTWICSIDALCLGKAPLGCKSSSCPSKASSEPVKLFHSISAETNERGDYLCSAFGTGVRFFGAPYKFRKAGK